MYNGIYVYVLSVYKCVRNVFAHVWRVNVCVRLYTSTYFEHRFARLNRAPVFTLCMRIYVLIDKIHNQVVCT